VNLEFSSDKDERAKALGECIKIAEQIQKVTDAKVTAGLATEADALEAKALLQELRVHLLREGTKREK
jgi:outer membrane protein TolC